MYSQWIIPVLVVLFLNHHVVFAQVDEKQLKDVAKLRDELGAKLSPDLKTSPVQLAEVDAIRNEILNAVKDKKYKMDPGSTKSSAATVAAAKDPIVGSPLWNRIHFSQKSLLELTNNGQPAQEAEGAKNWRFLGKYNLNSNSYRDVIDLVEVQENLNFESTETVLVWRTIPNSMPGNRHLLLGLTNNSLILAHLIDGSYRFVDELKIADSGLNNNTFEAFLHWNNIDGHSEGYAIVVVNTELKWIRLGADGIFEKLELMWRWPINKNVTQFKFYRFKNESMIFLGDNESPTVDIYRFNLDNREVSQIQMIRLPVPPKSIAIVEWKRQLLLALPLRNSTRVYKYSDRDHQFAVIETIATKGVTSAVGFQAGGLCFFAIGGEDPKILRYRNHDLSKVAVVSKSYQFVRSFTPIPIHTFRDDVLILVQFEVPFEPHTLSRISTLRWNGEAFETFFNVPCYMDETLHYNGVNCLIDSDESMGLKGSVVLTKSSNVSLLVPRRNSRSGLFDLKIEIRAAPHPKEEKLIDIQLMFDYLAQLKEHNNVIFRSAMETIENAVIPDKEMTVTGEWTVDVLDADVVIPEENLVNKTETFRMSKNENVTSKDLNPIMERMVHDLLKIEGTVEKSVPRKEGEGRNNEEQFHPKLQLEKIQVKDIEFATINGIPKGDIVWRLEDNLQLTDTLEVQSLSVLEGFQGKVNGIDLEQELIHSKNNVIRGKVSFENLSVTKVSSKGGINGGLLESVSEMGNHFAKLAADELFVEDDFDVEVINGVNWVELSQELLRLDLSPLNATLVVDGNLIVDTDVDIDNVNDEPFLENFLFDSEEEDFISVTGTKVFNAPAVVNNIDMDGGAIDGVAPNRLISLAGNAYLPSLTIFGDNIELVHGLIVNDSSQIEGMHMDKFLANPTLKEERLVGAACAFKNLKVEGNIILKGLLNDMSLSLTLPEFLYITEKPIQVKGFNKFKHLQVHDLNTELLNGKELESFVTLDTDQTLKLSTMIGRHFCFDNMQLGGLFDFINVTELYDKSIRTTGDQVTEAHILIQIPDEDGPFRSLENPRLSATAKNVFIRETLNTHPPEVFLDSSNIFAYTGLIEGGDVAIDRLYLSGDFKGSPVINGHHMDEYDAQRWSKTRVQTVTSPVVVQNLINSDFGMIRMNSISSQHLAAALDTMNGFEQHYKKYNLDGLHVMSGGWFDHVNGELLPHLMTNVIWLNETNELPSEITCLDGIQAEDTIFVKGSINGEMDLLHRVVWRDQQDQPIKLKGTINFHNGVVVEGHINATTVNGVNVADVLTKDSPVLSGDVVLRRSLKVHSQLIAPHWKLFGNFEAHQLSELYKYDAERDVHEISLGHPAIFNTAAIIPNLSVGGALNNIPNIIDFLNSIQQADSPRIILKVSKSNFNKLLFKDLQVDFVNGFHLEQFMSHAVLRLGESIRNVSGKVQFSNTVESITIHATELSVDNVNRIRAEKWFGDSVQLSQPLGWEKPVLLSVANNQFQSVILLESLNGVPFELFDFKFRDHHMSGETVVEDLIMDGFMGVFGLVNGLKLEPELKNSLLIFAPVQTVLSHSTFAEVRVTNKLTIEGFVNGINFSHVIPLNGQNIFIESPISFDHLQTPGFYSEHIINGLEFNSWYGDAVKYSDSQLQNITGYWHVGQLNVQNAIRGVDYINGRTLTSLLSAYDANRPFLQRYESELQFAYWKMCNQVKDYFTSPLRVGCSFQHLEPSIQLNLPAVTSMLVFRHLDQHYMIFSSGCTSRLLLWNMTDFQEIDLIPSGSVTKWTYVPGSSTEMHLVAQNGESCPNVYANGIWAWNTQQRKLVLVKQLSTTRVDDVLINPLKRNYVYIIVDGKVQELNVPSCEVTNEWPVQDDPRNLRFLPCSFETLELLVSGGQQIHTIKISPSNRSRRNWLKFGHRWKRVVEKYKFFNDMVVMNKSAFIKLARDAILSRKLKAIGKLISPVAPTTDDDAFWDELRKLESNDTIHTTSTTESPPKNQSLEDNPKVAGSLFDDLQDRIEDGAEKLTDLNSDGLSYLDRKYNVEEILDMLEEELLTSSNQNEVDSEAVVGGAIFDDIQHTIQDGAEDFVDVAADVLDELDEFVDLEQILQSADEKRPKDIVESQIGNNSNLRLAPTSVYSKNGEVVALNVGAGRQIRTMFAVSNPLKSIQGTDLIFIYEDLFVDLPFQTIEANRPSSLTAWKMDQETLLIFLEDRKTIQIYVFRGMMGFVPYLHVNMPFPVDYLRTAILPWAPCGCLGHFLMASTRKNVLFLKAETVGNCINEIIECSDY